MKLLIIRHADPDYSIDSLTETGWKEAELLSQRLSKMKIDEFYCSPLGRAKDTASLTLKKMNCTATTLPWLCEFRGQCIKPAQTEKNICWDWLPADWTQVPEFFDKDLWFEAPPFKGTNVKEEALKVWNAFDSFLADHGYVKEGGIYKAVKPNDKTIALFCHFGVECVLLGRLLGLSPMNLFHSLAAAPSSVTTVVTEERREGIATFRMTSFGDTSHLYAGGREPSFACRFCECYSNKDQRHD